MRRVTGCSGSSATVLRGTSTVNWRRYGKVSAGPGSGGGGGYADIVLALRGGGGPASSVDVADAAVCRWCSPALLFSIVVLASLSLLFLLRSTPLAKPVRNACTRPRIVSHHGQPVFLFLSFVAFCWFRFFWSGLPFRGASGIRHLRPKHR